jgi:hypothetical protein
MQFHKLLIPVCTGLLLAGTALAGSISCGDATITDDQDEGPTTQQVANQCGQPTSTDGDNWIYDRSNVGQGIYVLHFNGSGQLDSIQQQVDQD